MRNDIIALSLCTALLGFGCAPADEDEGIDEIGDVAEGGKADGPPTVGPLRVMEAMVTPRDGNQYLEVINDGATPVDLAQYFIATKTTTRTGLKAADNRTTTLPPGAIGLIVANASTLAKVPSWMPAAVSATGKIGSKLKTADTIRIFDSKKNAIEQTSYTNLKTAPDVSMERTAPHGGMWTVSPVGASPGSRNASLVSDNIHSCFNTPPFLPETGCKDELVKFLGQATKKIDVAVYQANLTEYFQALLAAKAKGIAVRVVTDTSYFTGNKDYKANYDMLAAAGITVIDDQRSALMHSKYIVIDDALVWTGSFNFLIPRNPPKADNALWFRSTEMARGFEEQFEQQFTGRAFGPKKKPSTVTEYYVDGMRVEAYFAPKDPTEDKIAARLSTAQQSINFAAFSFFSDSMETIMKERHASGIDIRGIFDMTSVGPDAAYRPMLEAGIDVRTPDQLLFLHDKFLVVDENGADPTVLTGSYNFSTSAASSNDESLIFVHDQALSRLYGESFRLLYLHGHGPNVDMATKIKITKVMAAAADEKDQYVEIQNTGAADLDLTSLTFSDADAKVKLAALSGGATILPAGQTARIVDASAARPPTGVVVTTESGQLGDGLEPGDIVKITGGQRNNVLDTYSYPVVAGLGKAVERMADLDLIASWKIAQ